MASIRFGSIVTGLKGSVGGTTYREFRNGFVMQKRSAGGDKKKLRANSKLPQLANVIAHWSTLPSYERSAWRSVAQQYPFPDKWGNMRNLTGREFFIKMANYCVNVGNPIPEGYEVSDNIIETVIDYCDITSPNTAIAHFVTPGYETWATVHGYPMPLSAGYVWQKYGPIVWGGAVPANGIVDISAGLWGRFPYLKPGDRISIGSRAVSYYGYPGWSGLTPAVVG